MKRFKTFRRICKQTQKELANYLVTVLEHNGYEVVRGDGFIYAKGTVPVLLTAHMDTVHKENMKHFCVSTIKGQHQIHSPQGIGGDDRCGIYMILQIIKTHKCSVLFCEDEEIGRVGAGKFCKTQYAADLADLKYLIELDRANEKDAVFYSCDNPKFTEFITKNTGYNKRWGSYSDISTLAPHAKVAAVNLSCGYYRAHTTMEYVIWEEMLNTIEVVKKLLDVECEQFEYIESKYASPRSSYGNVFPGWAAGYCAGYYNRDWNDDDDYYLGGYRSPRTDYNSRIDRSSNEKKQDKTTETYSVSNTLPADGTYSYVLLEVQFLAPIDVTNKTKEMKTKYVQAKTKMEAWGKFFTQNPGVCYNDVLDFSWDWI